MPRGKPARLTFSLHALIAIYKTREEYTTLKASTRQVYDRILDRLNIQYGHADFRQLTSKRVRRIQDEADSPTTANRFVSLLSILGTVAVDIDWIEANPAGDVKKRRYNKGHHHDWTDAEMGLFLNRYGEGTRERLAFLLFYDLAQRGSDTHLFGPQRLREGRLQFRQEKTGKLMEIPLQPDTLAEINRHASDQLAFILSSNGRPYKRKPFQQWFSKRCNAIGLTQCSAHGLRGARLRHYAEAGASVEDMKSIGGHSSESQLQVYIRNASQKRLASRAARTMGELNLATLQSVAKNA